MKNAKAMSSKVSRPRQRSVCQPRSTSLFDLFAGAVRTGAGTASSAGATCRTPDADSLKRIRHAVQDWVQVREFRGPATPGHSSWDDAPEFPTARASG